MLEVDGCETEEQWMYLEKFGSETPPKFDVTIWNEPCNLRMSWANTKCSLTG